MAAATNTAADVIRYLAADDGYEIREGPYEFDGGERAVAYVADHGAYTDIFRVEVKLHSRGADREARDVALRASVAAAEEAEREWTRLEPHVGRAVTCRGEPAYLTSISRRPDAPGVIDVECVTHVDRRGDAGTIRCTPADVVTAVRRPH